ncbi:HNH endonuclease signature motif containing protein [Marinilactibacillus sp. XAAS-LB27]|uniref:HNH endonuclease n=1 Tax=Marinilactibacillus sp. XAAS-LB27 TaxID=3114538 RepID=UPI002E170C93|nr:HNH endonuclease signature motif containing protein [Marinilactibacillus sp. XAAS-LB27]
MYGPRKRDDIDKLYKTQRWKKLRPVIIARDFGLCQECKRRGITTRGNIVHHIVEAREDLTLFWNEDNLEVSCDSCHNKDHPERSGGKKKTKPKSSVVKFYAVKER